MMSVVMSVVVTAAVGVVTLVVVVLMMMLVVVVVTAALTFFAVMMLMIMTALTVFVLMMMLVVVLLAALVTVVVAVLAIALLVMVMMIMIVTTLTMFVLMIMLMVVMTATFTMFMMMLVGMRMLMIVTALTVFVRMSMLMLELFNFGLKGVGVLHSRKDLLTLKGVPVGGDNNRILVEGTDKVNGGLHLFLGKVTRMAEDYGRGVFYLIIEKLAEVSHVHLALVCVNNGGEGVEMHLMAVDVPYRLYNVAELANARGLDKNSFGGKVGDYLFEGFSEVAHQRATDTARIHFGYLDARFLHKAAVNAYLTELVLDKHQLFARVGFLDKLFDKGGLSRTQKA
jgi:hypothetical protein